MAPMPKPRTPKDRLFRALELGLLVATITSGFVGLVGAQEKPQDPASTAPIMFGLPARMEGDRGTYVITSGDSPSAVAYRDFEWGAPTLMRDAAGRMRAAEELVLTRYYTDGNRLRPVNESLFVDAATHEAFASKSDDRYTDPKPFGPVPVPSSQARMDQYIISYGDYGLPFCGLFNSLQGKEADLRDYTLRLPTCEYPEIVWTENATLKPVGRQGSGPDELLVFHSEHARPNATYWFSRDYAYPVRIELADFGDERHYVIRLDAFTAGTEPLTAPAVPAGPFAPRIEYAPRTASGPDEDGLLHPFPLSAAFKYARDDPAEPTLRNFLSAHPTAYMSFGMYRERHESGMLTRSWTFMHTDGDDELRTVLVQSAHPTLPIPPTYSYPTKESWLYYTGYTDVLFPQPTDVPSDLPTVPSLMARWRAYATDAFATKTPNQWAFLISCGNTFAPGGCGATHFQMDAGYYWWGTDSPEGAFGEEHWSHFGTGGAVDERPTTGGSLYERDWTVGPAVKPSAEDVKGAEDPAAKPLAPLVAGSVTPLWYLPPAYAAGAGVFAVIIGTLYWCWPYLKASAFVGFFSRVEKPAALAQPRREELMNLIEQNPGIHFMEIVRRTGQARGNAQHHLGTLVRLGLINEVQGTRYNCYYAAGAVDHKVAATAPVLKAEGARTILAMIRQKPGVGLGELARLTNLSTPTAHYHVKRLEKAGLLTAQRGRGSVHLTATPLAATALEGTAS